MKHAAVVLTGGGDVDDARDVLRADGVLGRTQQEAVVPGGGWRVGQDAGGAPRRRPLLPQLQQRSRRVEPPAECDVVRHGVYPAGYVGRVVVSHLVLQLLAGGADRRVCCGRKCVKQHTAGVVCRVQGSE